MTLTNLLLTGILLMQAYALIFRDPARKVPERWKAYEAEQDRKWRERAGNPVKFPPS